jgi:hypothetical protein
VFSRRLKYLEPFSLRGTFRRMGIHFTPLARTGNWNPLELPKHGPLKHVLDPPRRGDGVIQNVAAHWSCRAETICQEGVRVNSAYANEID